MVRAIVSRGEINFWMAVRGEFRSSRLIENDDTLNMRCEFFNRHDRAYNLSCSREHNSPQGVFRGRRWRARALGGNEDDETADGRETVTGRVAGGYSCD